LTLLIYLSTEFEANANRKSCILQRSHENAHHLKHRYEKLWKSCRFATSFAWLRISLGNWKSTSWIMDCKAESMAKILLWSTFRRSLCNCLLWIRRWYKKQWPNRWLYFPSLDHQHLPLDQILLFHRLFLYVLLLHWGKMLGMFMRRKFFDQDTIRDASDDHHIYLGHVRLFRHERWMFGREWRRGLKALASGNRNICNPFHRLLFISRLLLLLLARNNPTKPQQCGGFHDIRRQ